MRVRELDVGMSLTHELENGSSLQALANRWRVYPQEWTRSIAIGGRPRSISVANPNASAQRAKRLDVVRWQQSGERRAQSCEARAPLVTEAESRMHADRVRREGVSARRSLFRELRFDDLAEVAVRRKALDLLIANKEGRGRLDACRLASLIVRFDERTGQMPSHAIAPGGHAHAKPGRDGVEVCHGAG